MWVIIIFMRQHTQHCQLMCMNTKDENFVILGSSAGRFFYGTATCQNMCLCMTNWCVNTHSFSRSWLTQSSSRWQIISCQTHQLLSIRSTSIKKLLRNSNRSHRWLRAEVDVMKLLWRQLMVTMSPFVMTYHRWAVSLIDPETLLSQMLQVCVEENKENAGKKLAKFIWMRIFLDFYDFELTLPIRRLNSSIAVVNVKSICDQKTASIEKKFNSMEKWMKFPQFLRTQCESIRRRFPKQEKTKIRETFRFSIQNADKEEVWNFTIQRKVFAERRSRMSIRISSRSKNDDTNTQNGIGIQISTKI